MDEDNVKYENSPPPSDYEFDEIEYNIPSNWRLPFPRCNIAAKYLPVDRSLSAKGKQNSENIVENKSDETSHDTGEDINDDGNMNAEQDVTTIDKSIPIAATNQKSTDSKIENEKKRAHEEIENSSKAEDNPTEKLQEDEIALNGQKKQKHCE